MIFKNVTSISNNSEKRFFIEQIEVFTRLIEVYCEKNNITNAEDSTLTSEVYNELIDIGVINSRSDIDELKKLLKKKYNPFIKAVKFCVNNKEDVYDTIWKLSNSERQKAQQEAKNKHNLTLVDFFCGAGGLSLGFIQEGFNVKLASDIEPVCIQTYMYNHPQLPSNKLIQEDIRVFIDDIDELERKTIKEKNSRVPNGYNVAEGGQGGVGARKYGMENRNNKCSRRNKWWIFTNRIHG